jgi:hypothetical protein
MRLSGPRSRPTTSHKICVAPGIERGTSGPVARNSVVRKTNTVKFENGVKHINTLVLKGSDDSV